MVEPSFPVVFQIPLKSTKSKANDERNEAKTTLDRLQEEFEINKQKLEERQKELDLAKSNNVTLENQIETLTNEVSLFEEKLF